MYRALVYALVNFDIARSTGCRDIEFCSFVFPHTKSLISDLVPSGMNQSQNKRVCMGDFSN